MRTRGVLGHGAGQLVLNLANKEGISVREAGSRLIEGCHWEEVVS